SLHRGYGAESCEGPHRWWHLYAAGTNQWPPVPPSNSQSLGAYLASGGSNPEAIRESLQKPFRSSCFRLTIEYRVLQVITKELRRRKEKPYGPSQSCCSGNFHRRSFHFCCPQHYNIACR